MVGSPFDVGVEFMAIFYGGVWISTQPLDMIVFDIQ